MMNSYYNIMRQKARKDAIIVDTNLLVVLIIGLVDKTLIGHHKRTRAYNPHDFNILFDFINSYGQVIVTPSILTEVSNLLDKDQRMLERLGLLMATNILVEIYNNVVTLISDPNWLRLGISDMSVVEVAKEHYIVLTDDRELEVYLHSLSLFAVNYSDFM